MSENKGYKLLTVDEASLISFGTDQQSYGLFRLLGPSEREHGGYETNAFESSLERPLIRKITSGDTDYNKLFKKNSIRKN